MLSSRPRRLFVLVLSLPVLFLLVLFLASRRHTSSTTARPSKLPDEIFGLLHFVTSPDEAGRVITVPGDPPHDDHGEADPTLVQLGGPVVPEQPVALAWYALGSAANASGTSRARGRYYHDAESGEWEERLRVLHENHPLVVFSKSYCPYSKRAKALLETYDLEPAPKIVEVDLRADSPHIKTLLTRLTQRSTFPNVILRGRSLGGSDDLVRLHQQDQLRHVFDKAGVKVRWSGEGDESD